MEGIEVSTQNFRDFFPEFMGVGVRISNSGPRFKTRYDKKDLERIPQLFPNRDIFRKGLSPEEFRIQYRKQLDMTGVAEIDTMFEQIARRHPDQRLVLLCFEKVLEGEYCHRRVFAEWWFEQTGEPITEIAVDVNTGKTLHFTRDLYHGVTEGMAIKNHNRGMIGPIQEEMA